MFNDLRENADKWISASGPKRRRAVQVTSAQIRFQIIIIIKGASAREKACTDHGIHGLLEFTMALCSSGPNGTVIGPAKLVKFLRERGRTKKKECPQLIGQGGALISGSRIGGI